MKNIKFGRVASAAAIMLGSGVLAPMGVFAEESSYDLVTCASGNATKTCTLSSDVELTEMIKLTSDLTVDLNGHKITSASLAKFFETKGYDLTITGSGSLETTDTTNTGIIRVFGVDDVKSDERTSVTIGEDVELKGPNPIVIYNNNGTAYNTTVDVYGKLFGQNSGIWLIGSIADKENYPVINIHDDAVISADASLTEEDEGGIALSAMGYAEWNIGNADITGVGSGIGIKGGIVNVDGARVLATADIENLPPELYNNGMNPSGAAIQIEKNAGYPGDIELSISDGFFESQVNENVIYEYGTADAVKSIEISGGTFNRTFDSEYLAEGYKAFEDNGDYVVLPLVTDITLGYGDEDVKLYTNENQILRIGYNPENAPVEFEASTNNPDLFQEGSLKIVEENGVYAVSFITRRSSDGEGVVTVTEKNSGVSQSVKVIVTEAMYSSDAVAEDGTTAFVGFKNPIEGEDLAVRITGEELTTEEKSKISPYLKAAYDLSVVNLATGEVVPVSDNEIDVTLILKKADYEGMKYFKVGYINDEDKLVEVFDADVDYHDEDEEENEYFSLSFTTTHFSTYGILASATEFPEALTPDTGMFTGDGTNPLNNLGVKAAVTVGVFVVIALIGLACKLSKR